ncbi:MAG: hypothetical protein HQL63_02475 [Magnetococcales bacterium]|nr:hypothetical protein [Magnetococcales bacterium]
MNTPQKMADPMMAEFLTESRQTMVMLTQSDLQAWVQNLDRLAHSSRHQTIPDRLHTRAR